MVTNVHFQRAAIAALLWIGYLPAPLFAQDAALHGTVRDAAGGVVPGATVTAHNLAGGVTGGVAAGSAVSDTAGAWRVTLRPGSYRVTAALAGLAPAVYERVDVAAGADAVVDLVLTLSGLTETVSVTGSHIRTTGFQAMAPLQVASRAEIENAGLANFSDIFKEIPGNSGSEAAVEGLPRSGQSQFNLRGLGYSSTLTLINGRRAGVAPVSDDSGAEYTDVNQFPLAMVERVEVLKDGASAVYGADAVAGVVNVITRRAFKGMELSGGYQSATNQGGSFNLATGRRFSRSDVNVYATYYTQTGNDRTDFDWLVERIGGNGIPGRSQLLNTTGAPSTYRPGGLNPAGQPIALAGGVGFADPDCETAGGVFRIRDDGSVDRANCLHNFADQVAILPAAQRLQVFSEFSHRLNARINLSAEASFSRNVLETTRGPGSYANGTVTNATGNVYIPASHPFNFYQRDPSDPTRLVYVQPSAWNPAVNQAVDVVADMRPLGVRYNGDNAPKRRSRTNYPRVGGAIDIDLGHTWIANASFQHAAADFTDFQPLRYNAAALNQLIVSGRFNPFGTAVVNSSLVSPKDGVSVAGNTQAVLDQFVIDSLDAAETSQQTADVTASGETFRLRELPVRLAVGAQYRRVTLETVPDPIQGSGRGDTRTVLATQTGEQDVIGAFAEVAAPIGATTSTQIALRFEDHGRYGTTLNPKFAAATALGDRLRLRGSWGTSFQSPSRFQVSESVTRVFLNDPVRVINGALVCQSGIVEGGNVQVKTVGDDTLRPQHSANANVGVVVRPFGGLQVSTDYWNYRYKDLIGSALDPQAILDNDCRLDGIPNDPRVMRSGNGGISEIETSFVNVGRVETDGLDLALEHRWQAGWFGAFNANADITWLRRFNVVGGSGSSYDGAGSRNFTNPFRTMPRWRGVAGVNWTRTTLFGGIKVRYIGSYKNDQSNNALVEDYMPVDLSFGHTFAGWLGRSALTLMIGVDNLTDLPPPGLARNDASGRPVPRTALIWVDRPGYDTFSGADLRGRVVWLRATHRF
jgi:iron complex outermembrane receptor protein